MESTVTPVTVRNLEYIGKTIKTARLAKGWSQEGLARRAGLNDRRPVAHLESGKTVNVWSLVVVLDALDLGLVAIPRAPFKVGAA